MRLLIPVLFAVLVAGCSSSDKKIEAADTGSAKAPAASATKPVAKEKVEKKAAAASTAGTVSCTSGEDKRSIEVRAKDSGCETAYTKAGNESVVATSNSGTDHCAKVQSRIQENLKTAGFTCQ